MVGTFLEPSCGRRYTPIHSIPYSVAQPLERGSNNYYSIIHKQPCSFQFYRHSGERTDFRACQFLRGQQAGKQNPGIGKPYPGNNKQLFPIRTARGNPFACPGFFCRSSCSRARTRTTPEPMPEPAPEPKPESAPEPEPDPLPPATNPTLWASPQTAAVGSTISVGISNAPSSIYTSGVTWANSNAYVVKISSYGLDSIQLQALEPGSKASLPPHLGAKNSISISVYVTNENP